MAQSALLYVAIIYMIWFGIGEITVEDEEMKQGDCVHCRPTKHPVTLEKWWNNLKKYLKPALFTSKFEPKYNLQVCSLEYYFYYFSDDNLKKLLAENTNKFANTKVRR